MTAEGHLLFAITFSVYSKNIALTSILAQGDWWHIISSSALTCLLPDIDHPKSFFGQRLKWISQPIFRIFGHRGFTHSLLIVVFFTQMLFYLEMTDNLVLPMDVIQGMILGYVSHIVADMLTPAGVPLLWPCRWRFRLPILIFKNGNQLERIFCMIFFLLSIWTPQSLLEIDIHRLLSMITDLLTEVANYLNC